ncbi:MAG: hypothetical protein ACRD01_02230 [Terriglobales bacterium]
MNEQACQERVRYFASQVGLEVFFIAPGQLDGPEAPCDDGGPQAVLGAVFTLEDYDSELQNFVLESVDDAMIQQAVERARHDLAVRCGCEIVHDGAGVFRCLRHDVECDTGEEQDPVIRQTLRWTAACPVGGITQAFYLMGHRPPESN